jgi:DNA-binding response OmpR family regulator
MGSSARVLAVDDDRLVRMSLRVTLRGAGLEVDTAATCREATTLLKNRPYGVVLTDLDLPDDSGLEVARCAQGTQPGTVVLLLTGSDEDFTPERATAVGVDGLILKPYRLADLLQKIQTALGEREPERSDA